MTANGWPRRRSTSAGAPSGAAASLAHGAHLVFLRWLQGRPDEVEALLERLIAQQAWGTHAWPKLLPLAYAGQAREADARRRLDAAMAALPGGRPSITELVAAVAACGQLGDGDAAGRLWPLLLPGPATTWPPATPTWARPTTTSASWPPRPGAGGKASGTSRPPWPPTNASGRDPGRR